MTCLNVKTSSSAAQTEDGDDTVGHLSAQQHP